VKWLSAVSYQWLVVSEELTADTDDLIADS
jgi:hypothetical protein